MGIGKGDPVERGLARQRWNRARDTAGLGRIAPAARLYVPLSRHRSPPALPFTAGMRLRPLNSPASFSSAWRPGDLSGSDRGHPLDRQLGYLNSCQCPHWPIRRSRVNKNREEFQGHESRFRPRSCRQRQLALMPLPGLAGLPRRASVPPSLAGLRPSAFAFRISPTSPPLPAKPERLEGAP